MLQSALKAFADLFRPKVLSFMVGVPLLALGLWGLGGVVLLPLLNHLFLDLLSYLQIQSLLQGFFGPETFSQGASVRTNVQQSRMYFANMEIPLN